MHDGHGGLYRSYIMLGVGCSSPDGKLYVAHWLLYIIFLYSAIIFSLARACGEGSVGPLQRQLGPGGIYSLRAGQGGWRGGPDGLVVRFRD